MGNVDAGKSSMFGHLSYLLKEQSDRDFHKVKKQAELNKKESFCYAYFLDLG